MQSPPPLFAPTARCAAASYPGNPANSISRRIRRNSGNHRQQLGAPGPSYSSLGSNPPAISISGHDPHTSRYPAPPTQHPAHPSAQPARSGVRSEHPHPAERTRKLQVHMGLVASATARIASNNRRVLPRPPFTAHFAA